MDSDNLILTEAVAPPSSLPLFEEAATRKLADLERTPAPANPSQDRKKQIAKDFESILLARLLDEMKETIGEWGFENNGASKQMQGLFWLYLARDMADKGGLGLWEDLYKWLNESTDAQTISESLDKSL